MPPDTHQPPGTRFSRDRRGIEGTRPVLARVDDHQRNVGRQQSELDQNQCAQREPVSRAEHKDEEHEHQQKKDVLAPIGGGALARQEPAPRVGSRDVRHQTADQRPIGRRPVLEIADPGVMRGNDGGERAVLELKSRSGTGCCRSGSARKSAALAGCRHKDIARQASCRPPSRRVRAHPARGARRSHSPGR